MKKKMNNSIPHFITLPIIVNKQPHRRRDLKYLEYVLAKRPKQEIELEQHFDKNGVEKTLTNFIYYNSLESKE